MPSTPHTYRTAQNAGALATNAVVATARRTNAELQTWPHNLNHMNGLDSTAYGACAPCLCCRFRAACCGRRQQLIRGDAARVCPFKRFEPAILHIFVLVGGFLLSAAGRWR